MRETESSSTTRSLWVLQLRAFIESINTPINTLCVRHSR